MRVRRSGDSCGVTSDASTERPRFAYDSPLGQAGLTQAFNNNGLDWLTGLTADIDTKGFSGAVANLRRDPHPPPTKNKEPPALLRRRGFLVANIDRKHTHIE